MKRCAPTRTSSPGRAPAACSARSTPSRSSSVGEDADGAVVLGVEVGEPALDAAAGHPQEAAVAQDAKLAPRRRLRPVDEEVGQLGLDGHAAPPPRPGPASKSACSSSAIPSPVAAEQASAAPVAASSASRSSGRDQIDLREHDELWPLGQPAAVELQLAVDRRPPRVDVLGSGRGLDQVDEEPGALEVREELVPQADSLARALQQARDVGDRELAAVVRLDRSEHGLDRS